MPAYKLSAQNYSKDDRRPDIPFSSSSTFHDFLEEQLGLRSLSEREHELGLYIIGNIDDDGYLRRDLLSIADDLAFTQNVSASEEELEEILKVIHDFDPPGVGARGLQECLLLQLERREHETLETRLAKKILKEFFGEFTKKHYERIKDKLDIDDEELKKTINEILKLNPKPGVSFGEPETKSMHQVVPDFILESKDGDLQLSLNSRNVPDLRLSRTYSKMMQAFNNQKKKPSREQRDTMQFMKQKFDSAKWFIDAVKQRQTTMMLTMNAILEYQYEYFQEGDESKLRPMILKDIAEMTGLDISTISRVVNSKYIQTHFGIFPLKYFFSEGMQSDTGEEVSTREIKNILAGCINNEDKKKPLTDEKLATILKEKGYPIARRTVAKYREQLNLPVARLRKEL